MRRDVILVVAIPVIFLLSIQFIMAISFQDEQLEEKISFYDINYVPSTFDLTQVDVWYESDDLMRVDFFITGGDGSIDLYYRVYCQDINHITLISDDPNPGTVQLSAIGAAYSETHMISTGEEIWGDITWENVPSGEQIIRLYVSLDDIYLDTWTFSAELRDQ